MTNLDTNKTAIQVFNEDFKAAMEAKDFEAIGEAVQTYSESVREEILDIAREYQQTADASILASRGVRQLTSAEQKFYDNLIASASSEDPKQALTGGEKTFPQTVIDTVIEDIENAHPLLAALKITNTYGSVKFVFATDTKQLASWGQLTAAITQEISGTIEAVEFRSNKLTAFMPVPKDILDLGASYVDAYVRKILADALACGLEYGAIYGTGNNMPIGMTKDLDGSVTQGEYPDKTPVALSKLDVKSYTSVIAQLATKRGGRPRTISKVALIVNPVDYLTKIIPATTVQATDGTYKNNVFPFPTEVFPSEMVEQGTAILGILDNYILAISTGGVSGNIQYSDQYQFLEDVRTYIVKLTGTGRPVDNTSFIVLNIANLKAAMIQVEVTNIADAKS